MAELVDTGVLDAQRALRRLGALRDDDDRRVGAVVVAVPQVLAHRVDVEGPFGDQDEVGAAGEAGGQREPSGMASHHLDEHHPVVALGGGVEPVDRVGGGLHGGVEPERDVGRAEVVVDRLRDADGGEALLAQGVRDAEGVLAADDDERVHVLARQALEHGVRAVLAGERVGA